MTRINLIVIAVCSLAIPAIAADAAEPPFLAEFKKLQSEIEAADTKILGEFGKLFVAAKTAAEQTAVRKAMAKRREDEIKPMMARALPILLPHAAEKQAVDPLAWWLEWNSLDAEAFAVAKLLITHHITHPRTFEVAERQILGGPSWAEKIYRAVMEADVSRKRKAEATMTLARWLADSSMFLLDQTRLAADHPTYKPHPYHAISLEDLKNRNPADLEAEAIRRFKQIMTDYPELKDSRGRLFADRAKSSLFEIANLRVGKIAPEIDADDLDGKRFKLSDHRGKVVLLVFWASWCGPCMANVPHERELVARMKDRPFVLIGVNGDPTIEAAQKAIEREKISWRSFRNGGPEGPTTNLWNISGWPTVYVLDAKGAIRGIRMPNNLLDLEVERLTKQLEAERK